MSSKSKKYSNQWSLCHDSEYADLKDSFGENMPYLMRSLDKTTNQQLLIWRDTHPDIKSSKNRNTK